MSSYRALLVPDPRFVVANVWAAHSNYTEVNPRPGVPTDENAVPSRLSLEATGDIASTDNIDLVVTEPGFPDDGLRFSYANGGNAFRWDPPIAITGVRWRNPNDYDTSREDHNHVLRLASGDLLGVCKVSGTDYTGSTTLHTEGVFRMDGGTGTWTFIDTVGSSQTGATMKAPCTVQLPDGRILLFDWRVTSTSASANIDVWYSDDDGDTWAEYATDILGPGITDYSTGVYSRLRVAYSNGQLLLVACPFDGSDFYLIQLASSDLGCTWATVYTEDPASTSHAYHDIIPGQEGGFWVYSVNTGTSICVGQFLANAWTSLGDVSTSATMLPPDPVDEIAVWQGEDGRIWLAGLTTGGNVFTTVSWDGGQTFREIGSLNAASGGTGTVDAGIWRGGESGIYLTRFSVAEVRGRSYMLTETSGAGNINSYGTLEVRLGGHTDITMPRSPISDYGKENDSLAWGLIWAAFRDPADFSTVPIWTTVDAGASPSATYSNAGVWRISTDNTESRYYELTSTSWIDVSDITGTNYLFLVEAECVTTGTASAAADDVALLVRIANASHDYEFRLRLTETSFAVFDQGAGANLGAPVTGLTSGERRQYLIFLNGNSGVCRAYYRTSGLVRDWTLGISGTLTDDTGGGHDTTPYVRWGNPSTVGLNSDWNIVAFTSWPESWGYDVGSGTGSTRPLSASPITLPTGLKVRATGGPGVLGEAFNVLPVSDNPIANAFPASSPSPRAQFVCTWDGNTKVAVEFHDTEDVYLESTSIGASFRNTNAHGCTIEGYDDDTSTWVVLADEVEAGWQGVGYVRSGNTITIDTTADGHPWQAYESLVGGRIILDDNTPTYADRANTILHHNEGRLSAETGRSPVFTLDPDTMTGSEPASGKCWIIPPSWTLLVHDVAGPYRGYRLTPLWVAGGSPPANSELEAGAIVFGPLVAFGRQYSATRTTEVEPNVELTTSRSGARTSRVLGPNRRRISFSWTEGVDTRGLQYATTTSPPNAVVATDWASSRALAAPADTPLLVRGVLDRTSGSHTPIVYLPRVDVVTGDGGNPVTDMLSSPGVSGLYCRITSNVGTEVVLGNEAESEVMRIRDVELEEEV